MANVNYWSGAWYSSGPNDDIPPGGAQPIIAWGDMVVFGTALTVTAHPLNPGDPNAPERILAVEDLRIQADAAGGRRVEFNIRNWSADWIYAVNLSFGWITS